MCIFHPNAAGGDVRWTLHHGQDTADNVARTSTSSTSTAAAPNGNGTKLGAITRHTLASSVAVDAAKRLSVVVSRVGADAADTLAGNAQLLALIIRQAGT